MENKTAYILLGVVTLGAAFLFLSKKAAASTSKSPASLPASNAVATVEPAADPVLNWKETQSAGDNYMETNLQILVNGEEKVMEYFSNSGTLQLKDGDLVNITVNPFGDSPDMAWAVSGTNNLIVKENGVALHERAINTQEKMNFSFLAKKGKVYEVINYTMPS